MKPVTLKMIESSKQAILDFLKNGPCKDETLEKYVYSITGAKKKKGKIELDVTSTHLSAFIMAYKELEDAGQIKITRPFDVPFQMTDYKTLFELKI